MENLPVAIFALDSEGHPVYANPAAVELLGRGLAPEAKPRELGEIYRVFLAGTNHPYPTERMPIVRALAGESSTVEDMEIERPSGRVRIRVWASPIFDADSDIRFAIAAFSDITRHKATERTLLQQHQEVQELALTDDLTGLGNRRGIAQVGPALITVAGRGEKYLTLVFLDLDDLKAINDTFGHPEGDRVLRDVARILVRCVRDSDYVARVGGDEFCVLLTGAEPGFDEVVIDRLRKAVANDVELAARPYRVGVSLGVARLGPGAQGSIDILLEEADEAMYVEKARKKRGGPGA
jgi:diguanylate cyclase (GGDEF)-like protein